MNHMNRENSLAAALTASKASPVDQPQAQAMLGAQVSALDAIFYDLAGRAATGTIAPQTASQTQLAMALKAQTQCRAALTALAKLQAPPPVSRAPSEGKNEIPTNGLMES